MSHSNEAKPAAPGRDTEILALLLAGNPDGLRHLVEDHGATVMNALARAFNRFLPAGEVDEAMTSALVRLWETPTLFDVRRGSLRAWLYVLARNCALSLVRRRQRRIRDLSIDAFDGLLCDLATTPAEQERLRRLADLHGCLSELSPMQRAVLQADLAANGVESTTVLAERLGTSRDAIYSARHRGRAELARMMQRLGHYADRSPEPQPIVGPALEFG